VGGTARLQLKVVPGATHPGIVGWLGDMLKIRVSAPPEKGKANDAIVKLLAGELALPESSISIVSGRASSRKSIQVDGISTSELLQRLGRG